jgi:FG-GAP-like repeat
MVACRRFTDGHIAGRVAAGRVRGVRWALGGLLAACSSWGRPRRRGPGSARRLVWHRQPAPSGGGGRLRRRLAGGPGHGRLGSGKVSVLLGRGDGSFGSATDFGAGTHPASVVVGDFDGVGPPDLAVANNGSSNVSVLLGKGDGTFSGPANFDAGGGPESVAVGDLNADFDPDLAVADKGAAARCCWAGRREASRGRSPSVPARRRCRWRSGTSTAIRTPTWRSRTAARATCRCGWARAADLRRPDQRRCGRPTRVGGGG